MRVLAPRTSSQPAAAPQAAAGTPLKPVPWNITTWRQRWGAFWGPANRDAIRQAMEGVK
jgi:hypothetical protein